jgi:uncharacterized membrane protein
MYNLYEPGNTSMEALQMELSPEERKKIYEEEKAKIEAGEPPEQEKSGQFQDTSVGIAPNVAGLLCYLGGWITGIIFLVLEQKNNWIRYHAAQSIVVFGSLFIAGMILGHIPFVGPFFSSVIGIIGFILWIILMVKTHNGERYKVIWAGDIAERMVAPSGDIPDYRKPPAPPEKDKAPPPPTPPVELDEKIEKKVDEFFKRKREGRITASAFAIAWSIILLVFFNFFHEYIAYYTADTAGGVVTWTKQSFFTSDISLWLPILTTTLVISIIGHIVLIIVDRDILRQAIRIIIDGFGLATVITLITVFPFDFEVIPNAAAAAGTHIGVLIVLICIAVGLGISLLVRVIKLLVNIARAAAGSA